MTNEPVAYLAKSRKSGAVNATVYEWNKDDFENIPLYTKEQLQPRVKMTSELRDKFIDTRMKHATFYSFSKEIYEKGNPFYSLTEDDLMRAWLNPEETIEIIPDMKWFVVTKETNDIDKYEFLRDINFVTNSYGSSDTVESVVKFGAQQFDTKGEAEKWTNPLTEAVLLPVEEE